MTRQEVQLKVIEYEDSFPVENYRMYDWNVWPLLRSTTAYNALMPASKKTGARSIFTRITRHQALKSAPIARDIYRTTACYLLKRKLKKSLDSDSDNNSSLLSAGKDIVLLTLSGRRQKHQDCLYEIYTDPLVEHFRKKDVNTVVWEKGEELTPRCNSSAWISRRGSVRPGRASGRPPAATSTRRPSFSSVRPLAWNWNSRSPAMSARLLSITRRRSARTSS